MTLKEMKRKILSLVEEYEEAEKALTSDPDIATKINDVINQKQYELARVKKIPAYIEIDYDTDDIITFETIKKKAHHDVYQIQMVKGIEYESKAEGTVLKVTEGGTAEIEYFRYPTRLTKENEVTFEFDLSDDVLEIMPYGVAADLLKTDPSTNYGQIFAQEYEKLKNQLDIRYSTGLMKVEGGYDV